MDILPPQYYRVNANPDEFIRQLYQHKREHGFWLGVVHRVTNAIAVPIISIVAIAAIGFVRWDAMLHCTRQIDGSMDAAADALAPTPPCGQLFDYILPLQQPPSTRQTIALLQVGLLTLWWLWCVASLCIHVVSSRAMARFYATTLQLSDADVYAETWDAIVNRIQHGVLAARVVPGHAFRLAVRLLRQENYWIALYCRGSLDGWTFAGVDLSETAVLHRVLQACLVAQVASPEFVSHGVLPSAAVIRRRGLLCATVMLLALPALLPFLVVYCVFKYTEEFHSRRTVLGPRTFSFKAKWLFREYNETQHVLERRLAFATPHAERYLSYFVRPVVMIVASKVVVVAGFVLGFVIAIAMYDEDVLLKVHVFDHNVLWYAGMLSIVLAAARAATAIPGRDVACDAPAAFDSLYACTHYYDPSWRRRVHTTATHRDVARLFPYLGTQLLRELAALFLVPLHMLARGSAGRLSALMDDIQTLTRQNDVVGHVCVYSTFEGVPDACTYNDSDDVIVDQHDTYRRQASAVSKMTRSMIHYRLTAWPDSEPANGPADAAIDGILATADATYKAALSSANVHPSLQLHVGVTRADEPWFYWVQRCRGHDVGAVCT